MKITTEINLNNFEFWSGAKDNAAMLTFEQLKQVESELEAIYENGITEEELNDLFWLDFSYICQLIGLEYDEENDKIKDEDEEDEEES